MVPLLVKLTLFSIMFALGLGLQLDALQQVRQRPALFLRVLVGSCFLVPLAALLLLKLPVAQLLSVPGRLAIALMAVSPSAPLTLRKAGKQVRTVGKGKAAFALPVEGDHLAVIGDNGKILVFPLEELPEMPRGKGVRLQGYREGGLRDALVFRAEDGAAWIDAAGRTRAWPEWRDWAGRRAGSGRAAPRGFPASRRFRPA